MTLLAQSNVHPKTAQTLARHSTIALTMDRYTHTVLDTQAEAVEALHSLSERTYEAVPATGTDGTADTKRLGVLLGVSGAKTGYNERQGETRDTKKEAVSDPQSMGAEHGHVGIKDGGAPQNRTGDTGIFSPLLYQLS